MILRVLTQPAEEPVSVDEAKVHLRIDAEDEDNLLAGYLVAARQMCELVSRRAFITQTLQLSLETWPGCGYVTLPRPPFQSVTSCSYIDSNGNSHVLSSNDYIADTASEPGRVLLGYGKSWPSATLRPGPAITITYVAGYGLRAAVPAIYKQAIELLAGHFYENREQVIAVPGISLAQLPLGVQSLLMVDRGGF